VYNYTYF